MSLEERGRVVAVIRRLCEEHAAELGRRELDETGIGRLDHKIEKLRSVKKVLGVEALRIEARSDSLGPVRHRARAVGRHRHGAAGHALRARPWPATPST